MKKIQLTTSLRRMMADLYTPVGIYLRLRDRYRDTILLESTDSHVAENSYSFICINAIAGMEIRDEHLLEYKLPGEKPEQLPLGKGQKVTELLQAFMQRFEPSAAEKEARFAQGLYGYTSFDAVRFFDRVQFTDKTEPDPAGPDQASTIHPIPLMRYRLYQYVIVINHFRDELILCENQVDGVASDRNLLESLIRGKDVPEFPFRLQGEERSNMDDETYRQMVREGIRHCQRGDVFQIVLSRRFRQGFQGDEFNVYRALRNINPSPYLFFFDYGDYKLMGSSPESQLIIRDGEAVVHPIAGTFRRTGDDATDQREAERLLQDAKENAEHVMLVDLARNDLSRLCDDVRVVHFRQVHYYSHVIHLVSEVRGKVRTGTNPFQLLALSFPAGTLSGAPKIKAMELITALEPTQRSWYGGALGFIGFDGSCNHAIMIRSFLSKDNTLTCQAGAGVVVSSDPQKELEEVNHKLGALKKAMDVAQQFSSQIS